MRIFVCRLDLVDNKGLVALWRETLALKASIANGRGWINHPQCLPVMLAQDPASFVEAYLYTVHLEGKARGYDFKYDKLDSTKLEPIERVRLPRAFLVQEIEALQSKLARRDPDRFQKVKHLLCPRRFPLNTTCFERGQSRAPYPTSTKRLKKLQHKLESVRVKKEVKTEVVVREETVGVDGENVKVDEMQVDVVDVKTEVVSVGLDFGMPENVGVGVRSEIKVETEVGECVKLKMEMDGVERGERVDARVRDGEEGGITSRLRPRSSRGVKGMGVWSYSLRSDGE